MSREPALVADIQVSRGMKAMERGPATARLSDRDGGTTFIKDEYLFRVVVLMKWDSLSRCHSLGHNAEILCVPVLAIELNGIRPAASRARAAHQVITVALLQNHRFGRRRAVRTRRGA